MVDVRESTRWSSLGLFVALLVTSVVIRLPSILWPFTINVDENTFLLVAQRLLHGELPYTTTFDNKSPLAVLFQSAALLLVGPNPHLLRLLAALLAALTAFALVAAAPGKRPALPAYATGFFFLALWAALPDGLAWMTSLNVALVFAIAFLLVTREQTETRWQLLLTGMAVGALPLVAVNWSPVFVCIVVWYAVHIRLTRTIALFLVGALLPLMLTVAVYAVDGSLERLWRGAVVFPLMVSDGGGLTLPSLSDDQLPDYWLLLLVITSVIVVMTMQLDRIRLQRVSPVDWLTLASVWALTPAMWFQAHDSGHHTLQLVPFIALAIGRLLAAASGFRSVLLTPLFAASVALLFSFAANTLSQYDWRRQAAEETAVTQAVADIPDFETMSLWIPDAEQFVSWRLDKPPITPIATHPYLLWHQGSQQAFFGRTFTAAEATQLAFDLKPDVIIAGSSYRPPGSGANAASDPWESNLQRDYKVIAEVSGRVVWQRIATA